MLILNKINTKNIKIISNRKGMTNFLILFFLYNIFSFSFITILKLGLYRLGLTVHPNDYNIDLLAQLRLATHHPIVLSCIGRSYPRLLFNYCQINTALNTKSAVNAYFKITSRIFFFGL